VNSLFLQLLIFLQKVQKGWEKGI